MPMQLGMNESRQTAVEFSCVTDNARGSVQHSLQPVCNELRVEFHPDPICNDEALGFYRAMLAQSAVMRQ